MNAATTPLPHPEALLLSMPAHRARELSSEINGLLVARDCATHEATPQVVYGRIDSLIEERRAELNAIFEAVNDGVGRG